MGWFVVAVWGLVGRWGRVPCGGGSRVFAPASDSLSLLRQKKSKQKKATPLSASPALRYGNLRCGASSGSRSNSLRCAFAQTIASPDPLAAVPILGRPHTEGWGPNQTAIRAIASLGPLLWAQGASPKRRAEVEQWPEWLFGCSPLAAPAARLRVARGRQRIRSDSPWLSERRCEFESEFPAGP